MYTYDVGQPTSSSRERAIRCKILGHNLNTAAWRAKSTTLKSTHALGKIAPLKSNIFFAEKSPPKYGLLYQHCTGWGILYWNGFYGDISRETNCRVDSTKKYRYIGQNCPIKEQYLLQKNLLLKIGFGTKTSLDEALWVETGFMQTLSRETKFLSNKSTAENHTQN